MHFSILTPRSTVCLLRQSLRKTNRHKTQLRWLANYHNESFSLPLGNNGAVSLNVTRPASPEGNASAASKVILYLPPGPLFKGLSGQDSANCTPENNSWSITSDGGWNSLSSDEFSAQNALANMTSTIVVTVNYRLGPSKQETHPTGPLDDNLSPNESPDPDQIHQYPTPIHDTLTGLDWILKNLQPTQLGVFGSHIGGSLALMLALTEAQSVHAVAALDPICDWPGLDEYCITEPDLDSTEKQVSKRQKKHKRKVAPPDLVPLLEAREAYFSTFSRCFDPFASPVLLLRSAGRDVPKIFPRYLTGAEYPVPVLDTRDISAEQDGAEESLYQKSDTEDTDLNSAPVRRRKALSRWPPYGLDFGSSGPSWSRLEYGLKRLEVELPWVRVFSSVGGYGESSDEASSRSHGDKNSLVRTVLGQQAEEMVSVMRRACFWGREKGFGERRVTLSRVGKDLGSEVRMYFEGVFGEKRSDVEDDY